MNDLERTESNIQSSSDDSSKVADGFFHTKIIFVNSYFVDTPENTPGSFVLIDTEMPYSATRIKYAVENRYGAGAKPKAIVFPRTSISTTRVRLSRSPKNDHHFPP